jgi:hypothetical protein
MPSTQAKFSPLFVRNAPGGPFTVEGIDRTPGDLWFVDSNATGAGATTNHGYSPEAPFSTLSYAFSSDLVGSGDTVYLMPSHAETVSGAGTITMDIAGVKVIGLGQGGIRPTFTFSAAAATWLITAASCSVDNILCTVSGVTDVVAGITVTAADVTLTNIEAREGGATAQFVDFLILGAGSTRAKIKGFKFAGAAGDASVQAISVTSAVADVHIEDVWIYGTHTGGSIVTSAANLNMLIKGAYMYNLSAAQDGGVVLNAGTTGLVINTYTFGASHDANGFNLSTVAAAAAVFDAQVVNLAGERGGYWGTASTA